MPKIGEIKIEKGAVVCVEAQIEGDFSVEIGAKTVIHPKAQIIAEKGPIKIGKSFLERSLFIGLSKALIILSKNML